MKTSQLANNSDHFGKKLLVCGKVKRRLEAVRDSQQPITPLQPPSASLSLRQGESGLADGKSGMQRDPKNLLNKYHLPF